MISFTDMILLPLLAFFVYKSTIKISFKTAIGILTFGIILYAYLFFIDTGNFSMYGIRDLISPVFYIILAYIIFFKTKKFLSPIQTLSISFLFIWLLKDFWELPDYIVGITFGTWNTTITFEYIFFSIFCLSLLWIMLKPKVSKLLTLIIGITLLFFFNFVFYHFIYSNPIGIIPETYYMFGRIIGAITLYFTFIKGESNNGFK